MLIATNNDSNGMKNYSIKNHFLYIIYISFLFHFFNVFLFFSNTNMAKMR